MKGLITIRRFFAYVLDMMIVILISSLFAGIESLNPHYKEYEEKSQEYLKLTTTMVENNDAQEIISDEELADVSYDMAYYGLPTSIITLAVTFLYFVVFQYYNNGKTIGKALWRLKVTTTKNKKVSLPMMLLRSGLINSILTSMLLAIVLSLFARGAYEKTSVIIQFIDMAILFSSVALILFRDDRRGLHDLICSTKICQIGDEENSIETNKEIKEAKVVEKKEEKSTVSKKTTKKTTSKKVASKTKSTSKDLDTKIVKKTKAKKVEK